MGLFRSGYGLRKSFPWPYRRYAASESSTFLPRHLIRLEQNIGIIVASIPAIRPLFKMYQQKIHSSNHTSVLVPVSTDLQSSSPWTSKKSGHLKLSKKSKGSDDKMELKASENGDISKRSRGSARNSSIFKLGGNKEVPPTGPIALTRGQSNLGRTGYSCTVEVNSNQQSPTSWARRKSCLEKLVGCQKSPSATQSRWATRSRWHFRTTSLSYIAFAGFNKKTGAGVFRST